MRLWRRRDVQYIRLFGVQHRRQVSILMGNPIADGQLFCHQRFDIAYCRDVRARNLPDFLYVCVGDLAATNNRNFQNRTLFTLCSLGCA